MSVEQRDGKTLTWRLSGKIKLQYSWTRFHFDSSGAGTSFGRIPDHHAQREILHHCIILSIWIQRPISFTLTFGVRFGMLLIPSLPQSTTASFPLFKFGFQPGVSFLRSSNYGRFLYSISNVCIFLYRRLSSIFNDWDSLLVPDVS